MFRLLLVSRDPGPTPDGSPTSPTGPTPSLCPTPPRCVSTCPTTVCRVKGRSSWTWTVSGIVPRTRRYVRPTPRDPVARKPLGRRTRSTTPLPCQRKARLRVPWDPVRPRPPVRPPRPYRSGPPLIPPTYEKSVRTFSPSPRTPLDGSSIYLSCRLYPFPFNRSRRLIVPGSCGTIIP